MKEKVIVVIPARGGSKGVPKKNIKSFLGKPLVQHSIDYAKQSRYVKEIIVTTDDKKIKNLSKELNVSVIDRPESLSGDKATTESAIEHVIKSKNIQDDSIIVLLQPTSPIRPKKSLDKILEKFSNENFDSMLTLSPIHPLTWKINDKPECMYDYLNRPRRQDFLDKDLIYDENGSVYVFKVKIFNKSINRLGGNIGFYIFDEEYGKQIDTPLDFKVLEAIGNYLNEADDE